MASNIAVDMATLAADIAALETNERLYQEESFAARARALDDLEFNIAERLESLRRAQGERRELLDLQQRSETARRRLEGVDDRLFQRLRTGIATGQIGGPQLRQTILELAGSDVGPAGRAGYDALDTLTNGLLLIDPSPVEMLYREPEMIRYLPTPTRVVLELVDRVDLKPYDVFYDIGSGLGQVAILVHLFGAVRTIGVEVEPAFCDYARRCAERLNLSEVQFVNADARQAGYSKGTVFFMYSPFEGGMLQQTLQRLHAQAQHRGLTLCTYGPCTAEAERQGWLRRGETEPWGVYRLAIFSSIRQG
jgi:hypothetical protein